MSELKVLQGAGGGKGNNSAPTITPDTLVSEDMIEFTLAVSEGPVAGILEGAKHFYLDDTPLVSPTGEDNFTQFRLSFFHGAAVPSEVNNQLGGTTSSVAVNINLAQNTPITRVTPGVLRNKIDFLEVRLVFNQLIYASSNGDQLETTANFKLKYRESGSSTWLNFFATETVTLTGKTSGGYVKEFRLPVPRINNDWEIQVTKLDSDSSTELLIDYSWESYQAVTTEVRAYEDLALVLGLARATDQLSSIPTFSMVLGGRVIKVPSNFDPLTRHYSGVWDGNFVLKHTDSLVWCIYDAVMNERYGARRYNPDLILDRYSCYEAALWCDTLVPRGDTGTFQPRYTYNDIVQEPRSGLELIAYMMGIFGATLVPEGVNTVRMVFDRPGAIEQVFAAESVTPEGFLYQYSDVSVRPNDLTVTFINPELQWATDVRRVFDQTLIDRNGRITEPFTAVGCIDVYEAQRRAFSRMARANTEVMSVTFKTARQGVMLQLFSLIGIVDPDMNWGVSGRVKSVVGSTVNLRDSLFLPVNTDLQMSVQTPTGVVQLTVRTSVANTKTLTITAGTYPVSAPTRAQFVLSSSGIGLVKPFRVLSIEQDTNNPDLFTITAQEFNVNRFDDADQFAGLGVQNFQGSLTQAITPPTVVSVNSGSGHQLMSQDGSVVSRLEVEVSYPPSLSNRVRLYWRRQDEDVFQELEGRGVRHYIPNVALGTTYEVFARTVGVNGAQSEPSNLVTHTVALRTAPPATPTPWVGVSGFDTISLIGDAHPDPDFEAFRVYGATSASTTLVFLDQVSTTNFVRRVPEGDTFTRYKITALNRFGQESSPTAFVEVVPTPPGLADLDPEVGDAIDAAFISASGDAAAAAASAAAAGTAQTLAETARNQAQTAQTAAAASAAAALSSGSAASSAATAAANSATTAATQATAAANSATNAASSATTASGHASSASTSAISAANSATAAGGSATAASGSANNASTSATAAGTSATAAAASATSAATSAGAASTSASQASTSATNAAGSASSAATSASTAAAAFNSAVLLLGNSDFDAGFSGWLNIDGSNSSILGSDGGRTYVLTTNAGTYVSSLYDKAIPIDSASQRFRLSASFRTKTGSNVVWYIGAYFFDANDVPIAATDGSGNYPIVAGSTFSAAAGWQDREVIVGKGSVSASPYGGTSQIPAGAVRFRPIILMNYTSIAGAVCQVDYLRVEEVTSEVAAQTSATAAATSATAAAASQTAAGSSASAAATSATNAATSAGAASTSASQASTSATTAAGHASDASISATAAATSATAAGASATAASGSANSAATSATAAGTSATAAAASATSASTSAGAASTSASQAATSATNAAGSASSAATSASTAASAKSTTVMVEGNPGFDSGYEGWRLWTTVLPFTDLDSSQGAITNGRFVSTTSAPRLIGQKKMHRILPGRKYRINTIFTVSGSTARMYVGLQCADPSGVIIGGNGGVLYNAVGGSVLSASTTPYQYSSGIFDLDYLRTDVPGWDTPGQRSTTDGIYLIAFLNYDNTSGTSVALDGIWLEDVTESLAASNSATAAATSATAASASQTAAGSSASAAATSATNAATSASNASTSATQAATSATSAAGSSASAASSATTAATLIGRGQGAVVNQFPSTTNWADWQSSGFSAATNEVYPQGQTWTFNITTASDQSGRLIASTYAGWVGVRNATAYTVEVEFELISGSLDGAGVLLDWVNTVSTTFRDQKSLASMLPVPVALGQRMVASAVFRRPSGYTGTFLHNAIYAMGNYSGLGAGVKNLKIHRITITPSSGDALAAISSADLATVKATEAGVSSAEALSYRNATARLSSGGAMKNPIFNDWTGTYPEHIAPTVAGTQTITKRTSGVKYINAMQFNHDGSGASIGPWMRILSSDMSGMRPTPDAVLIRAEVEYVSGSHTGAYVQFGWWNTSGGTNAASAKFLSADLGVTATPGVIQKIEVYLPKPSSYVAGTVPFCFAYFVSSNNLSPCVWVLHSYNVEDVLASAETSVYQRAVASVDDITSATLGLRARAGGAVGEVEVVALDDPINGAFSQVTIAGDRIKLKGNTTVFESDKLQSSNYVAGTSGWRISNDGTAEFKNLVVRDWIVDQAVSDKLQTIATSTQSITTAYTSAASPLVLATLDMGDTVRGHIWKRAVVFDARRTVTSGSVTIALQRRRASLGGSFDDWTNTSTWVIPGLPEDGSPAIGGSDTNWRMYASSGVLSGDYDDFEYRLVGYTTTGVPGEVRDIYLTAINLVK